jgi:demethylsterigmatocystin 6-O-methyltransferase
MPANQVLPKYLKQNKYQNKTGGYAPFNMSQNTDKVVFDWEKEAGREDLIKAYHCFMSLPRPTEWYDVYPMDKAAEGFDPEKKIFVDVGGSTGHQCRRLLAKWPALKGRVVLEDLPQVIKVAQPIEGVEQIGYDMFDGQPIKGMCSHNDLHTKSIH